MWFHNQNNELTFIHKYGVIKMACSSLCAVFFFFKDCRICQMWFEGPFIRKYKTFFLRVIKIFLKTPSAQQEGRGCRAGDPKFSSPVSGQLEALCQRRPLSLPQVNES